MFEKRGVYSRFDKQYKGPAHYRLHHEHEVDRGKARFWVWIIVTTGLIAMLGYLTEFMDRCRQAHVFQSISFRLAALCFLVSLFLGGVILRISRSYQRNRVERIWNDHRVLFVFGVVSCVLCVVTFTVALIPPYGEACLAFGSCALLFIVNLGCLLLYD